MPEEPIVRPLQDETEEMFAQRLVEIADLHDVVVNGNFHGIEVTVVRGNKQEDVLAYIMRGFI